MHSGDADALGKLLAEDAVLYSDGGGVRIAALRPVVSGDKIARFFVGIARKGATAGRKWSRRVTINGLPGIASVEADGSLQTIAVEVADGRVRAVYITRNPDKLSHVAPLVPEGLVETT